jgi:serum amyloid A protein
MKEANWKNSDKYFHARGNYDAAQHGTGGKHAAKVIRYRFLFISARH